MACSCRHNRENIDDGKRYISELRELFIKRMTVDSEHHDARRRDFNQAIFRYNEDGGTCAVWCEMDMGMVLQCFDDAVKDWRRTWCDVPNCTNK